MALLTLLPIDPCWVALRGASGRLLTTVRAGVKPTSRRKWSTDHDTWLVHWRWLASVIGWAQNIGYEVDWSALPTAWQAAALGEDTESTTQSPYATLFLLENAPFEVVKAAYKALCTIFHPDAGGDEDKFRELNAAYKKIKSLHLGA